MDLARYKPLLNKGEISQQQYDSAKANADAKATDDTLLDYLKNVMPFEDAKAQLAKLDPKQRQIELGQRAISRYGCFSCHEIKGFEKAQPIGTDLSEEGSKLVTRLDFAFISDIPPESVAQRLRELE